MVKEWLHNNTYRINRIRFSRFWFWRLPLARDFMCFAANSRNLAKVELNYHQLTFKKQFRENRL